MNRAAHLSIGPGGRTGLILAGVLAVVTGVLVFAALQATDSGDSATPREIAGNADTSVITATQDIPARTEIKADMVQVTKVPKAAVLAGAYSESNLVVGRITSIPIAKGEQVLQPKLATRSKDLGLSGVVPDGMRAMAMKVDKVVSPSGLVRPGDRVDIIGVVDVKYTDVITQNDFTETRAITVAQNVEVLAVEQALENQIASQTAAQAVSKPAASGTAAAGATAAPGNTSPAIADQPDANKDAAVVTLSLTPEQLQQVMLIDEKGKIRLAVRAPGDDTIAPLDNTTFISLADPTFQKLIQDALKNAKK